MSLRRSSSLEISRVCQVFYDRMARDHHLFQASSPVTIVSTMNCKSFDTRVAKGKKKEAFLLIFFVLIFNKIPV